MSKRSSPRWLAQYSDISALAELNLETGIAVLRDTKTQDEEERWLSDDSIALLRSMKSLRVLGNDYVFPGLKPGEHLKDIDRAWRTVRRHAGLENLPGLGNLRIHDLRHNRVSQDINRGESLQLAGRLVGHRNPRSTQTYAHFAPDTLQRAANEGAAAMAEAIQKARDSSPSDDKAQVVRIDNKPGM